MWKKHFINDDIFFVTPDVKWGLGFAGILPKYHIVCAEFDPVIPVVRQQGANIFCLEEAGIDIKHLRNSGKLLETQQVLDYIKSNSKETPKIMYFKPSLILDMLVKQYDFIAVSNDSSLNELFEDKVQFSQIAQKRLPDYLMPQATGVLGEFLYIKLAEKFGPVFVIQFGHGWAGKTTFFIKEESDFIKLCKQFPFTKVKVSGYIEGFSVLNNCCIYQDRIYVSSAAVQIDGISQLSDNPAVTCGRQWPVKFLDKTQKETVKNISFTVGNLMKEAGFKGFFGIDFLVDEKTGQVYLSEVNARMTASAAFFTLLQIGTDTIPFLAYHLAEFLGKVLPEDAVKEDITGSQIILRKPYGLSAWKDKSFGVSKIENDKSVILREDYYPQKLSRNEYIFIGKKSTSESNYEFARIEIKDEVLAVPKKLLPRLEKLFTLF